MYGVDEIPITPSMFLIGQVSAMWPMSSYHSPHLLQLHLDFEFPQSTTVSIISKDENILCLETTPPESA